MEEFRFDAPPFSNQPGEADRPRSHPGSAGGFASPTFYTLYNIKHTETNDDQRQMAKAELQWI